MTYVVVGGIEDGWDDVPGNILYEFLQFVVNIADVIMSALQSMMFDDSSFWSNTMISNTDDNLGVGSSGKEDSGSWLYAGDADVEALESGHPSERGSAIVYAEADALKDGLILEKYEVPNILYSPENIFANKIAALDANFINPHQYTAVNENEDIFMPDYNSKI